MVQDKTQLLAHYIIFRSKPEKLGAVKLNKVMWFSDLESFRRTGRSISGQESYQKQKFGPVPNDIVRHVRALLAAGKIAERSGTTPVGNRREFIWLEEPNVSLFSANDVDIINRAIEWVCDNHSAAAISNKTHDALWEVTEIGEQIAIEAGIVTTKSTSGKYLKWALNQADDATEVH